MRDFKIGVTSESFSFHEKLKSDLLRLFPHSKLRTDRNKLSQDELITYLKDCDGAIVGLDEINDDILAQLPNLKIISKYGVGLNNLDIDAMGRRNIKLGWTAGVNKGAVSELTIAQMINLSRNIVSTGEQLRQGTWNKNGGRELSELTIGVIGVGHVGKEVIRRLQVFGSTILACDIIDQSSFLKPLRLNQVPHEEIFKTSDVITLHVPLDKSTLNLINKTVFAKLKPGAILINTARGGIINEDDLYEALSNKGLYAAAMDVFVDEPAINHKLNQLINFFPTPHISGNSNQAIINMGTSAILHLKNHFGASS